jgi:hypothetical protein
MANFVLITKARELSQYSDRHIRLLVRNNLVKGEKQGGVWLVDLEDLLAYKAHMESEGVQKFTTKKNKHSHP